MTLYTVHQNPDPTAGNDFIFVKDGFCWGTLFFPVLWGLFVELWFVSFFLALMFGSLVVVANSLDFSLNLFVVSCLLLSGLFAFEANDLRRFKLSRRGWQFVALIEAQNINNAERRFFSNGIVTASGFFVASSDSR